MVTDGVYHCGLCGERRVSGEPPSKVISPPILLCTTKQGSESDWVNKVKEIIGLMRQKITLKLLIGQGN